MSDLDQIHMPKICNSISPLSRSPANVIYPAVITISVLSKLYLAGNMIFYATPSPRCIATLFSFLPTHRFYNNLFRLRLSSLPLRATNNELFLSWWGFRLKFHSSAKTRKVNVLCTQYSVLLPSFSIRSENKR